jgi:hypothetical protein
MIIEPKTIDFTRYKRIFAFGCSFTNYKWLTWSDILAKHMPNAEYINAGASGAGNLYILAQLSQHNAKYAFNDTDLVVVMWSTFMREDRYLLKCWKTPGNIFTQSEYPDEYVKKYADTRGYLIRDLALIDGGTNILKNTPAHAINLMSVPASYQSDNDVDDVIKMYWPLLNSFPKTFVDYMGGQWKYGHEYYYTTNPAFGNHTIYKDYHPHEIDHFNYLKSIGIPLTDSIENLVIEAKLRSDTFTNDNQFTHRNYYALA